MNSPQDSSKRVVLLTGSELRHTFVRKYLGLDDRFHLVGSFCEGLEKTLEAVVQKQEGNRLRLSHLKAREQSEEDFFRLFVESTADRSNPRFLPKGEINAPAFVQEIQALKPDLLVCYGASLIREPLLSLFHKRFVNIHLGLSPYYRGSGTNYWPLVNGEPEFVGATFMHIDAGVDTGEVIHQTRARIFPGDLPAQIGNRLIIDTAKECRELVYRWEALNPLAQLPSPAQARYYKKKDYTEESVEQLYANFRSGLVERYLSEQAARHKASPILRHPTLERPA
jgi:phosphoribosylglycinamide formyltransferase-1